MFGSSEACRARYTFYYVLARSSGHLKLSFKLFQLQRAPANRTPDLDWHCARTYAIFATRLIYIRNITYMTERVDEVYVYLEKFICESL